MLESPFLLAVNASLGGERWRLATPAIACGVTDALALVLVNFSMEHASKGDVSMRLVVMYVCVVALHGMSVYALMNNAGQALEKMAFDYRRRILSKLSRVELSAFEKVGASAVQLVLGRDVGLLEVPSNRIFNVLSSAVNLACCVVYLAFLSPPVFLVVATANVCYFFYFTSRRASVLTELKQAAGAEGQLFGRMEHLTRGFVENKLHAGRRERLMSDHEALAAQVRTNQHRVGKIRTENWVSVSLFYFFLLAFALFILPSAQVLIGTRNTQVLAVLLFTFGAIPEIVIAISSLAEYDRAILNLDGLERQLEERAPAPLGPSRLAMDAIDTPESLTLKALSFSFQATSGERQFVVGPVDLEIRRGDLVFFVGGNGSGKTTLLRLMCGLYQAESGQLCLNGVQVDPDNVESYRRFFSGVFTSFHLFDRLYGLEGADPARVRALLQRFQIAHKTQFVDGRFTHLDLSTGQRKRLALVVALLEERPICILDEVSADQDPEFRRFYYEELLPELRAQGKTLLVVSHDDRFFHMADYVVHMDLGHIDRIEVHRRAPSAPVAAVAAGPPPASAEGSET